MFVAMIMNFKIIGVDLANREKIYNIVLFVPAESMWFNLATNTKREESHRV